MWKVPFALPFLAPKTCAKMSHVPFGLQQQMMSWKRVADSGASRFENGSVMEKGSATVVKNSAVQCKLGPRNENTSFLNYSPMDCKLGQESGRRKMSSPFKNSTVSAMPEFVSNNKENASFPSCPKQFATEYRYLKGDEKRKPPDSNFAFSASIPEFVPKNGTVPPSQPLAENKRLQRNGHRDTSVAKTPMLSSQFGHSSSDAERKIVVFPSLPNLEFVQEFGQRKYTFPGWVGPPPPKGCEVFIGKLPRDAFEDELLPLFQSVAQVYEFRLMIDFSGTTRGYAFATYTNKEDAKKAIAVLNGFHIRPRKMIGVMKSLDNCKLFIGGVPTRKTNVQVYEEMCKFTDGVVRVSLYPNLEDNSKNRGFAFVEYESHRAASIARRVLFSGEVQPFSKNVTVDWAYPEPDVDEEFMKEVTSLYVRNIPSHIHEEDLHVFFSSKGRFIVQKVRKVKDFAFIHFFNRNAAEQALSHFNGTNLDGSVIEATWAKPRIPKYSLLPTVKTDLSEQLVRGFSNLLNPSYALWNNPIQLLHYICLKYGFGEPIYEVSHSLSGVSQTNVTFAAQVLIHNWPLPVKHFTPNESFCSPYEAKQKAAMCALKSIEFYNRLLDPSTFSNSIPPRRSTSTAVINSQFTHRRPEQFQNIYTDLEELQTDSPFQNDASSGDPASELDLLPTAVALANLFCGLGDPSRNN